MILLRLFYEFFKTGLFSIGGGMATVPFLRQMATDTGWFTQSELIDMIAVAESTPGPIGVNMATYVGFETAGVLGAVIATIGLVTPSIIVILIIAEILGKFRDSKYVNSAFYGLRPASFALISVATISLILTIIFGMDNIYDSESFRVNPLYLLIATAFFMFMRYVPKVKKFHPLVFIATGAVLGVVLKL